MNTDYTVRSWRTVATDVGIVTVVDRAGRVHEITVSKRVHPDTRDRMIRAIIGRSPISLPYVDRSASGRNV